MKRLILLAALVCVSLGLFAQETKAELKTRIDVIRNETVAGGNTKGRIADAHQKTVDATQSIFYIEASGTDTYTASLLNLTSYTGKWFVVRFANANTGASTLTISPLATLALKNGASDLEADDIVAGNAYLVYFDGTYLRINLGGGGTTTTIVGITGTKAEFNTAVTDGDFLYVGDVTQYTDEMAQDATGVMIDGSLVYVDGTPLLTRAALTGDVTASQGSNTTTITSSVNLSGNPTTTTQSQSDNSTKIATTAFVYGKLEAWPAACSDETTPLAAASTSVPVVTFYIPYGFTITRVFASLTTAGTGASQCIVDIHEDGTTIMTTTKILFSTGQTKSADGTVTDSSIDADSKIEIFLDQRDTDNVATGLKVYIIGHQ